MTNRSFIDSRTFDGFRACAAKEFNEIRIVDLGGDVRGGEPTTRANVFGIRVGVAISFLVRKKGKKGCEIRYCPLLTRGSSDDKLQGLQALLQNQKYFHKIDPSPSGDWIRVEENDFACFPAVASKAFKQGRRLAERAIFEFFSLGLVTARDEWVYSESAEEVEKKVQYLVAVYNDERSRLGGKALTAAALAGLNYEIKWTRAVKNDLSRNIPYKFDGSHLIEALYRPYSKRTLYFDQHLNEMRYQLPAIFGSSGQERTPSIVITDAGSQKPFMVLACDRVFDYHVVGAAAAGVALPFRRKSADGEHRDNISDWSLDQFKKRYQPGRGRKECPITKEAIFHYVYGVLHDPVYREKYAFNLKREFPRIPLYADFWQWSDWGRKLMDFHIGYEHIAAYPLARIDIGDDSARRAGLAPKALLRADRSAGRIMLDSETTLVGVPTEAWEYRLGNRSALDWILDQYKEAKPRDPTIRERFNSYRFADYKERVIDLLARVMTVSVSTVEIINAMRNAQR